MKINTIMIIDKNQKNKNKFVETLKKEVNFSYTKIEAMLRTIMQVFPEEYNADRRDKIQGFLGNFFEKLVKKDEIFLVDIDNLSAENANILAQKYENILVVYLEKIETLGKIISIDVDNQEEVEILINKIKRMMGAYGRK